MARAFGSKNKRTLIREARVRDAAAETSRGLKKSSDPQTTIDSLAVMEAGMWYFYGRHLAAVKICDKAKNQADRPAALVCAGLFIWRNLIDVQEQRRRSSERSVDWSNERPFEEAPMELPEDIRREIEKSGNQDTILDVVRRLQSQGVEITHDVIAAIVATIAMTEGGAVC